MGLKSRCQRAGSFGAAEYKQPAKAGKGKEWILF